MSEYILKVPEYESPYDPAVQAASLREEIVRCRDCDYRRRSWNGHEPNFIGNWFCAYTGGHEVEPDGFCAWGKRK